MSTYERVGKRDPKAFAKRQALQSGCPFVEGTCRGSCMHLFPVSICSVPDTVPGAEDTADSKRS